MTGAYDYRLDCILLEFTLGVIEGVNLLLDKNYIDRLKPNYFKVSSQKNNNVNKRKQYLL